MEAYSVNTLTSPEILVEAGVDDWVECTVGKRDKVGKERKLEMPFR
jgi:hypothetical protein